MELNRNLERFYWMAPGSLAGCSLPGKGNAGALNEDLLWLKAQDIGALVSLTETPLPPAPLQALDIEALHLPVPDMTAPLPEQLHRALEFIDWHHATGTGVAVHCLMGQGRTGTVLAAYLIRAGMSAEEAIAELRTRCPGALSSPSQEAALRRFAARQDWIL